MAENNNEPYLIITAGNTGSGKTSLILETLQYIGIDNEPYVKILVDDLVENDSKYKAMVIAIINKISELSLLENRPEEYYYNNPSTELYKSFSDAYFNTRNEFGCLGSELNCNDLNMKNLTDAVKSRHNIIFEFTGQYIPAWLLSTDILGSSYNIVFSCSVVTIENLFFRNTSRAIKSVNMFKQDYTNNPAPRLPNVSKPELTKNVKNFRSILSRLYTFCILSHSEQVCGNRKINKLLVFDNNGERMRLIFDSNISSQTDFELINSSFGILEDSPSRRKKSPVKRKKKKSPVKRRKKSPVKRKKKKSPVKRKIKV